MLLTGGCVMSAANTAAGGGTLAMRMRLLRMLTTGTCSPGLTAIRTVGHATTPVLPGSEDLEHVVSVFADVLGYMP